MTINKSMTGNYSTSYSSQTIKDTSLTTACILVVWMDFKKGVYNMSNIQMCLINTFVTTHFVIYIPPRGKFAPSWFPEDFSHH